jgi:hypothetical protein
MVRVDAEHHAQAIDLFLRIGHGQAEQEPALLGGRVLPDIFDQDRLSSRGFSRTDEIVCLA